MIIQEYINGFWHSYSDNGVYIHGGFPEGDYEETYAPVKRNYVETDIPIETDATEEEQYAEAGRIFMGVSE